MNKSYPFLQKTQKSATLYQDARQWLPGGVTANIKYFDPYPIMMEKAKGPYLYDVDGNQYTDYNLCYGVLILGHGNSEVFSAVSEQLSYIGTSIFGTPHQLEVDMARTLTDIFPSIEKIRLTNSGLEATLLALRYATAWTQKKKIAKFEGHYHGSHDQVLISVNPETRKENQHPSVTRDSLGLPDYYLDHTILLPFNNIELTAEILHKHRDELAAVILEPVQGGFIPPDPEFLKELRHLTEEYGIALIFDEVKTGFRVGLSGAQGLYGITPDLTALGKVLGGGFPIGAVGGKKEILELSSPTRGIDILSVDSSADSKEQAKPLFHSGTYNGHPLIVTAGLTTISILQRSGTYEKLEQYTTQLRKGMEEICQQYNISGQTVGAGSIFNLVIADHPIKQVQDVIASNLSFREQLDGHLLDQGIFVKPLNRFSMSTAHDQAIVDDTLERFEAAVKKVTNK